MNPIKRQIRRALLHLSDTDASLTFGLALHSIKPIWKTRRDQRAIRRLARERRVTAPGTFNRSITRH